MNFDPVTIVGATGPTGTLVTQQLCAAGCDVTVIARSETRRQEFEALGARYLIADVFEPAGLQAALTTAAKHSATLVNLLGGNPFMEPATWPDDTGVRNTTEAADNAGFSRYILVTSVGTGSSWEFVPENAYIRPILELKSKAETHLKATGLAWTIVKPGGLGPPDYKIERGNPLITENHGVRGLIDREDLADVILRVLAAQPELTVHKELYAVVDRLEKHAGEPKEFALPTLA